MSSDSHSFAKSWSRTRHVHSAEKLPSALPLSSCQISQSSDGAAESKAKTEWTWTREEKRERSEAGWALVW